MNSMSGVASSTAPLRPGPAREDEDEDLFSHLVVSNPPPVRAWFGVRTSLAIHVLVLALVILLPVYWPAPLPDTTTDYIRALIYDPPPPPPPPLPKGSALVPKPQPAKPVTEERVKPETPKLTAPVEVPKEEPLKPEDKAPAAEQQGSPTGSEFGLAEGMEGGVEGGMVGGVPGGVLGGVLGGTGTGPVLDYDQPPRPIKITKPTYPQEAFIKKIEGTVVLEILIDSAGRVVRARVIQSVPLLDAAAVQTVYQWVFAPAMKHGRPVPTLAHAPVAFRIF